MSEKKKKGMQSHSIWKEMVSWKVNVHTDQCLERIMKSKLKFLKTNEIFEYVMPMTVNYCLLSFIF